MSINKFLKAYCFFYKFIIQSDNLNSQWKGHVCLSLRILHHTKLRTNFPYNILLCVRSILRNLLSKFTFCLFLSNINHSSHESQIECQDTFYTVNSNREKRLQARVTEYRWRSAMYRTASEVCRVTSREPTALHQGVCKNMK